MSVLKGALAIVLGCGLSLTPVRAAPILWITDAAGRLGRVDVPTGAVTIVGNEGVVLTDIAFDPSGNLYGLDFNNLYRVNTTTGAATPIGPHGVPGGNALVFRADGTLFAAGFQTTSLFSVNPASGSSTNLGSVSFASAGDLAFNGGNLFLSATNDHLIRIGLSPVSGTDVGATGFTNVFGLATADNNVLYGVAGTQVFSVNPASGAGTLVSNYAGQGLASANGTAFFTESGASGGPGGGTEVPEPASLLLFGVGLAGLVWRRGSRSPSGESGAPDP